MAGNGALAMECPCCGGEMAFEPSLGKLKCKYCDSVFTAEEAEAHFAEKEKKTAAKATGNDWGSESDGMCAYTCSNCSAELIADSATAVIRCPYCGNNTIAASQFSGTIRPDSIIPFAFTKEQAVEKYNSYYKGKWLVPASFVQNSKIEEIQGVYVPFWLYSGSVSVDAEYNASNSTTRDDTKTIKHYHVVRCGNVPFENVPADASKRMPDDLMDSIEPYDFDGFKNFSITYLPGFLAERFNVSGEEDRQRTESRVIGTTRDKTRHTANYQTLEPIRENFKVNYTGEKYALLPVWYFTAKWNDKDFSFAMNGQTGELTGDLPVSPLKLTLTALVAFLVAFGICYLLTHSMGVPIFFGLLAALIASAVGYGSSKPVHKAGRADNYMREQIKLTQKQDTFLRTEKIKINKDK